MGLGFMGLGIRASAGAQGLGFRICFRDVCQLCEGYPYICGRKSIGSGYLLVCFDFCLLSWRSGGNLRASISSKYTMSVDYKA